MLSNLSNFKQSLHFPFSNHDGSQEEASETDIATIRCRQGSALKSENPNPMGRTSGTVTVKIENVFKNLQPSMCQQPIFVAIFCCCLCP